MTAGQGRLKFLVFIGAAIALQSHALKSEIKQGYSTGVKVASCLNFLFQRDNKLDIY